MVESLIMNVPFFCVIPVGFACEYPGYLSARIMSIQIFVVKKQKQLFLNCI